MTKKQEGLVRVAIPFITLGILGLVGWGGHRENIKNNGIQVEKKVDKEVFQEFKEANAKEHELMLRYLEAIHGEELPKK